MKGYYVIMCDLFEVGFVRAFPFLQICDLFEVGFVWAFSFLQICDLFEVGTCEEGCQFDSGYSSKMFLKKN